MSTVIIEKVATAIRCTCGHLWLSTSKSRYPTCPRCHSTISRKKHAVILQSDTKLLILDRKSRTQPAQKSGLTMELYSNDKHKLSQDSGQKQGQNCNPNPKLQAASNCRACGTHITFKRLENGKSVAVQDDSNLHRCVEWKNWSSDEG